MQTHQDVRRAMVEATPELRAYAISLCGDGDRANDLVQQTFLRALRGIDQFEPGTKMIAWLTIILRNHYYSDCRKRRREVEDGDGAYAGLLTCEGEQMAHLAHEELCVALAELPSDTRRALMLVAIEGASYDEVARACNFPVGTVKSRIHRARARLAAKLSFDRAVDRRATLIRSAAKPGNASTAQQNISSQRPSL